MLKRGVRQQQGFTLLELMTVLLIIGILMAIAIPAYNNYRQKSMYTELVKASNPYKLAVEICGLDQNSFVGCSGNLNGVPANIINSSAGLVRHLLVINGLIYVFPNNQNGFTLLGDYYILTPTFANIGITWNPSGPGVTKGYFTD